MIIPLRVNEWNYQFQSNDYSWNYWIYHTEKWDLYCGTYGGDILFLVPESYQSEDEANIWVAEIEDYIGYTKLKDLQHLHWVKEHPKETIILLLM